MIIYEIEPNFSSIITYKNTFKNLHNSPTSTHSCEGHWEKKKNSLPYINKNPDKLQ